MSVFTKSLKTFSSDVLGEKREFKINNAIFAFLESQYGITLADLNDPNASDTVGAKFIHAVLYANGIETTLEDVLENTDSVDIFEFMYEFNVTSNENFTMATERVKERAEAKKEPAEKQE